MYSGHYYKTTGPGQIGKGIKLLAPAEPKRRSPLQEERHVTSELRRDPVKPIPRKAFSRENGKGEKDRRRVGRATAQACAHGDVFPQVKQHITMNAQVFQYKMSRPVDQIVGYFRRPFNRDSGRSGRGEGDIEAIGQRDGSKHGSDLVVSVGPPVKNPKPEIQLGVRLYPRRSGYRSLHGSRGADPPPHCWYWSSEKTS